MSDSNLDNHLDSTKKSKLLKNFILIG